jgi:predicted RecB family nuclease
VEALFAGSLVKDLYTDVARSGSEWPTMSFGIKSIAKALGFEWRDTHPSGAASIEWFHRYSQSQNPARSPHSVRRSSWGASTVATDGKLA